MSKYNVQGYLDLLNESYKFIKYYDQRYNKNINSLNYKNKLRYHLFCFSQIVFALRDRLFSDYNEKHCKICTFFEKNKKAETEVGIVIKLANEWKHDGGFSLIQQYSLLKEIKPSIYVPTRVEQKLPKDHKYNTKDKNLIFIFKKCMSDITKFCNENNFT